MDSLQHVVAVVPLGLVTGLLAYRTNSVKPGMLVHAVHNTGAVGFGALATALTPHISSEDLGLLLIGMIGVLGVIGLPAVVSFLRSGKQRSSVETHPVPEPAVDSLPVLSRELSPLGHASDARLASQAV